MRINVDQVVSDIHCAHDVNQYSNLAHVRVCLH